MGKSDIKKCLYCGESFDITENSFIKPNKMRYAHTACYENFMARVKSPPKVKPVPSRKKEKDEVVCLYCGEPFLRVDGNYKMVRINRYAHIECFEKHHTEDENYIDLIYLVLKDNSVPYDYQKVERQRNKMIKEGKTNQSIMLTLKYFYENQRGDPTRANGGIGIVDYIYDDAQKYYQAIAYEQSKLQEVIEKQENLKSIELKITEKISPKNKKKNFSLDNLIIEEEQ